MFWMLIYTETHLPTLSTEMLYSSISVYAWNHQHYSTLYSLMSVITPSCVCNFCSLMYDRKPRMDFFPLVSIEQIEDTLLPLASSQNSVFFSPKDNNLHLLTEGAILQEFGLLVPQHHCSLLWELYSAWTWKRWAISQRSGTRVDFITLCKMTCDLKLVDWLWNFNFTLLDCSGWNQENQNCRSSQPTLRLPFKL